MMKTLLILGATGQVGSRLLRAALADPAVRAVTAPTRRALPPHPKLDNPQVDYQALPVDAAWWRADAVLCALGTTLRKAGSRSAFRAVDHDYVLAAARLARQAGTPVFVLNSSLGADPQSRNFYLQVKGETEHDLAALDFGSLTLVRPSLLDAGPRPERRPGEQIALWFARRLAPLIPRRYRAVPASEVANSMLRAALLAPPGLHRIESEDIDGRNGATAAQ